MSQQAGCMSWTEYPFMCLPEWAANEEMHLRFDSAPDHRSESSTW